MTMPFCSNCGTEYPGGSKFCSSCGNNLGVPLQPPSQPPVVQTPVAPGVGEEKILWEGKPSGLGDRVKDAAHVNSTTYTITNQRILVKSGLLGKKYEEIELIRIKDIKVVQSLKARALGIGDIEVVSADATAAILVLGEVRSPNEVKETLRNAIKAEKLAQGVRYGERL
jgi:hypothetical protein